MPEVITISWEKVCGLSGELAAKIKASGFAPDYLVGITVGGLIPLALLAEELDVKNVLTVSANSYTGRERGELAITYVPAVDLTGKKVLLIDEIAESGETLRQLSDAVKSRCKAGDLRTAALAVNKETCGLVPDFFALEVTEWAVFPWEKEEE